MKKIFIVVCCSLILGNVAGQTKNEKWNVGVHGGLSQYSGDLGQGFYARDQAFYGFGGLSVSRYLTKRFDLSLLLTRGQLGYLASKDYTNNLDYNFRVNLTTANILVRYHLNSRESVFGPYVFAGATVMKQESDELTNTSTRDKKVDFAAPTAGIGFHIRLGPFLSIQFQEMFMYTLADDIDHRVSGMNDMYLLHTIGLTVNIAKKQKMRNTNWKNSNF